MANLNNEFSNKINGMATESKNKIFNDGNQLRHLAKSAGERVGMIVSDFKKGTTKTMNSGREYVKENPIKGVAIAAATGLLAGSLLTVAMRSRRE